MFAFFDYIIDLVSFIILFVVRTFEALINFFVMIGSGIEFVVSTVLFLPPFCQGAIMSVMGISILFLLLFNRK